MTWAKIDIGRISNIDYVFYKKMTMSFVKKYFLISKKQIRTRTMNKVFQSIS